MLKEKIYNFSSKLSENIQMFKEMFDGDDTFRIREFSTSSGNQVRCCAFFFDGMVDGGVINQSIVRPVVMWEPKAVKYSARYIAECVIQVGEIKLEEDKNSAIAEMVAGDTIILVDGDSTAIIANTKGFPTRSIDEPESEKGQRGAKDGFNEVLMQNLALIRRKMQTDKLKFEFIKMGDKANTNVCIISVSDLSDPKILRELKKRLSKVNLDVVLSTNYIQEIIKDAAYSPIKTIGITEKPDVLVSKLAEGRVALMVDGSPEAITVPYLMLENFQNADDYYLNYYSASVSRIIRILGFTLSVITPAIYVALVTIHREFIPTYLLLAITSSREGIPFSSLLETIILLIAFQILRDASQRAPEGIGTALSVVGGLVLGQAAVEARFVSAPAVIVVAFTGITALLVPKLTGVMFITRMALTILASMLGVFGIIIGGIVVLIHLCSVKSFGVPIVSHRNSRSANEDVAIRFPWFAMRKEGRFIAQTNDKK